jgi:hypothetical protein
MDLSGQVHDPVTLPPVKSPNRFGGWVGPRAGLDAVAKKAIPTLPLKGIEPGRPVHNLVSINLVYKLEYRF